MTKEDLLHKIYNYPVSEVSVKDLLSIDFANIINEIIWFNDNVILPESKPMHYWEHIGIKDNFFSEFKVGEIIVYVLYGRINDSDWSRKSVYVHPRFLFRFEQGKIFYSIIPLPYDYKTTSYRYPKYQITELNNRRIIETLCKNSNITSFLSYKVKLGCNELGEYQEKEVDKEQKLYLFGEGFYAYFAPELLLASNFTAKNGSPNISLSMLSSNKYCLLVDAYNKWGYFKETETAVNAIINLETFTFEKFDINRETNSL